QRVTLSGSAESESINFIHSRNAAFRKKRVLLPSGVSYCSSTKKRVTVTLFPTARRHIIGVRGKPRNEIPFDAILWSFCRRAMVSLQLHLAESLMKYLSSAAFVLFVMLAPLAARGDDKIIKLVSSLPRTGSANAQTTTIVNGIRMAIDEAEGKA